MNSAVYPYERIHNYAYLGGVELLPKKICDYLMDLPMAGYAPQTDNSYPRVRLMKYLFHDTPDPLGQRGLTTQEKLSLVFDPLHPTEPPTEKGYRIFPLEYVQQAQTRAQTILRCYVGNIVPRDVYTVQVGIVFEILTSYSYENNMKTACLSRVMGMEQCLWEALSGVNIGGVGTVFCDRRQMASCGSHPINDERTNVGRRITFGVSWRDSSPAPHTT